MNQQFINILQKVQQIKSKKPAVIIVEKPIRDENTHNSSSVQGTHQKGI